ncbi:MAG: hypothetical protein MJ165_03695 [Alphaproteobacteria bacterium]|nr:hypothetical protein [Alphaproteobacteria bacterium]
MPGGLESYGTVHNEPEFRKMLANLISAANKSLNKVTYKIDLTRKVLIADTLDLQKHHNEGFDDKPMSVILSTTGKLLRIKDIEPLFKQKFPDFHFDNPEKLAPDTPIYLESFDGRNVKYKVLSTDSLELKGVHVIDKDLNELWPNTTGKPSAPIVNYLSQTTEKVH